MNKKFNIWHDISADRVTKDKFIAVIEISKGSKKKYELDKETGMLQLDRILHTSTHYPANYGFIPRTYADDGDPLDVLVISSEEIEPMSLVECYPIGVIQMVDNSATDNKIVAIPCNDPNWNHISSIKDLAKHVLDEIIHFYQVYKQLEHKETTVSDKILNHISAKDIINDSIDNYMSIFGYTYQESNNNIQIDLVNLAELSWKGIDKTKLDSIFMIYYDVVLDDILVMSLNEVVPSSVFFPSRDSAEKAINIIGKNKLKATLNQFKFI